MREIRLPVPRKLALDKSVPQIKANTAWTLGQKPLAKGSGALVGVIDAGIDVRHPAFKDSAGKTRILRLWDKTFRIYINPIWAVPFYVDRSGKPLGNDPIDETGAQATAARTAKAVGPQFDYGIEFNDAQINVALTNPPATFPPALGGTATTEEHSHGEMTGGIAAGNPSGSIYVGVAPDANLIFVRTDLSDSGIVEAANYIVEAAKIVAPGKPVVINCSLGGQTGPHNGFSRPAMEFDAIMKNNPKVLIILSAGNERDEDIHAAARLPLTDPATTTAIELNVVKAADKITIWGSYNPSSYIKCDLHPPPKVGVSSTSGNWYISQQPDPFQGEESKKSGSKFTATLKGETAFTGDPDAHFSITIEKKGGVPVGIWRLEFASEAFTDGNLHLWVESDAQNTKHVMEFLPPQGDSSNPPSMQDIELRPKVDMRRPDNWIRGTMSTLGASSRAVTVAAYNAEDKFLMLSDFSCQGPCPKGLSSGLFSANSIAKPDIAAPGEHIDGPTSFAFLYGLSWAGYKSSDGTSYSAPHVAGVAALIWSQKPNLTNSEVKDILMQKARGGVALQDFRLAKWIAGDGANPGNAGAEKELWGSGMLDAEASVTEALTRP